MPLPDLAQALACLCASRQILAWLIKYDDFRTAVLPPNKFIAVKDGVVTALILLLLLFSLFVVIEITGAK